MSGSPGAAEQRGPSPEQLGSDLGSERLRRAQHMTEYTSRQARLTTEPTCCHDTFEATDPRGLTQRSPALSSRAPPPSQGQLPPTCPSPNRLHLPASP